MKVTLLNIQNPGDNKDYNGGFGTTWKIGHSYLSKTLMMFRSKMEYFPLVSYGYLAALLASNGHEVNFVDNEIPEKADLILLQVSLICHGKEIEFLKKIREKTKSKIGIIGPFASVKPELFLEYGDFVVVGEPEEAISKIKDKLIPRGVISSEAVRNLDALPYPDWRIFPLRKFSYYPIINKKPFTFILSSRGCPFRCSYCPYKVLGPYRERDPLKVVNEIEYLVKTYGIKGLMFRDPIFSLNKRRTEIIAREIIKKNITIEWGCETRVDALDRELIDLLFKAGLRAIKIGVESINDKALKDLGREIIDRKYQEEIIKYCEKKGIRVITFYMLALPGDTVETIKKTIRYAKKLNTIIANFTLCTPIPGTEFFEKMKDELITDKWEKFDNFHVVFRHKNLTEKQLLKFQERAIIGYYFRIGYLLKYLWPAVILTIMGAAGLARKR